MSIHAVKGEFDFSVTIVKQMNDLFSAPVFPNGDLNWSCTCIERDVIGPCNIEFRAFRQYIHDRRDNEDPDEIPEEQEMMKLHGLIRGFLTCTKKHPVYYGDLLKSMNKSDETDSDFDKKSDEEDGVKITQGEASSKTAPPKVVKK